MYDGDRLIAELDDQAAVIATLSWGAAGLFAYGSTQYQFDLQGSVVARTSSLGSVLSTHWYDANGTEQTTPSSEPFGYKGRYGYCTDRETGLILCTHRYLDPEAGRWRTRDPISYAGGVNLYAYCANRPVVGIDPAGQAILYGEWHRGGSFEFVPDHFWVDTGAGSGGSWPDGIQVPDPYDSGEKESDIRIPLYDTNWLLPECWEGEYNHAVQEMMEATQQLQEAASVSPTTFWACTGTCLGYAQEILNPLIELAYISAKCVEWVGDTLFPDW